MASPPSYSAVGRENSIASLTGQYPVQAPNSLPEIKEGGSNALPPPYKRASFGIMDQERVKASTVKYLRFIPAMPIWLAVTIFCFNVMIPGAGLVLFSFVMPCTSNAVKRNDCIITIAVISFFLAFPMLLTAGIGLGYMAAFFWSYATIATNRMYYGRPVEDNEIVEGTPVI